MAKTGIGKGVSGK